MYWKKMKRLMKRLTKPALSCILAVAVVISGLPLFPGDGISRASASTISVSADPMEFNNVYGGQSNIAWSYQNKSHATTLETCTVEHMDPEPEAPEVAPGAEPIDPVTPYYRNTLQSITTVPDSGSKSYTHIWNGNVNGSVPAKEGNYTICAVPSGASQYFYFVENVKINNPAPPAPKYIEVPANQDLTKTKHIIRGVAERGTEVFLDIQYTIRDENDLQIPGTHIKNTVPIIVPFDEIGQNDGSHLTWSKGKDFSGYFTQFPLRDDNKPEKYLREWSYELELNPYEIANISSRVERLPSNPYYNTENAQKNKSGISPIVKYLRYVAPEWNITWDALAGYYYKTESLDKLIEGSRSIAFYNLSKPYSGTKPLSVCLDNENCPGPIPIGWNLIIEEPKIAGQISYKEFSDDLKFEQITHNRGFHKPSWWDPINLATGDFDFHHTNMSLQAVMPLEFGVTYHSRDTYDGAVGYGWHHTYEWRIEHRDQGNFYLITPDGAAYFYTPKENETYQTPAGTYNQITKLSDGTYRMINPQGWSYIFRQDGMLYQIKDTNGNQTQLSYKGSSLIKVATDGASIDINYEKGGKIKTLTDHTGRKVTYDYDELTHDLKAIHLPDQGVLQFGYNKKHQLEEIVNPNATATLKNTYDEQGRVIAQTDFYGADGEVQYFPEEHRTVTKDYLGRLKTFEFDERFRQTAIHYPDGTMERFEYDSNDNMTLKVDRRGNSWRNIYDSNGKLQQTIDPLSHTTTMHYNAFNKPDEITDALGNKTIIGYDGKGNMETIKNPLGELSRINRDGRGVPTSIVNPKGETVVLSNYSNGFVEFVTDPLGYKKHLQRDGLNRVTDIVDALGQVSSMEYDSRDRVTAKIDALHNREEFQYDKDSNLSYHKDATGAESRFTYEFNRIKTVTEKVSNELSHTTEFFYDAVGNMERKVAPNGAETKYLYNNVNRMETMIVKNKNEQGEDITLATEFRYDGNGNLTWTKDPKGGITEIHYDERNLPDQVKDASGAITIYAYDHAGRLTRETNALGHGTSFGYDEVGRLIKVTDALNFATSFEYDKAGRLTKTIKPNGAVWEMFYDARGLLTGTKDPLGNTTSLERDELGRVRTSQDESGATTQYGYNALGFVTSIVDAMNHATSMSYDPLGRMESITDANLKTTSYDYDPLGRLTSVTNAQQATTSYAYDAVGNITSKTDALMRVTGYEYNNRNQLVKEINPLDQLTQLSYDSNGNVDHIQYPDNKLTAYHYDPMNRLKEIGYSDGKKVNYAYDIIGRRTSMNDSTGTTSYAYDALNRLTQVTNGANQSIGYEWTPTGQRSKVVYPDQTAVTYQYDLMDRMTGVTDASGLTTSYTYDKRGLLTQKKLPTQGVSTYQYDALGQVLNIRHANQHGKVVEQLQYAYDPVGNRSRLERLEDGNDEDDLDSGDHPESMITEYAYDALNQLTQVKQYNEATSATPALTGYSYDAVGNRLTKQSAWDTISNTEAYTYDSADKLLHWQSGSNYKDYTYDPRGNLLKVIGIDSLDDAAVTSLLDNSVMNQMNGWDSVTGRVYDPSTVASGVYGNKTLMSSTTTATPELMEEYIWDSSNRLKQHRSVKKDISQFFYDGDGNRTKMIVDVEHGPTDHSVGGNGQGNSNGNGNGNGNNGNGNAKCHEVPPGFIPPGLAKKCGQIEEPYPDMHPGGPREGWETQFKKKHWEFNYTNDVSLANPEPLQVTDKDKLSGADDFYRWKESYTYGAGGERISMTYLPAYDANNGWDPHDGTAGAEKGVTPRTLWYLNDAVGSAVGLIEKDGRVSSRYHYDEFGTPTDAKKFDVNWPGPDNLFGYTGLGYDYYSGMSYARARYYKPELGRFVSEDGYKGTLSNPQSQNRYAYVSNNPLLYIDPSGNISWNTTWNVTQGASSYLWNNAVDNITSLADWDTYEGMWEFTKALVGGDIGFDDLTGVLAEEYITPFVHLYQNFNHIYNNKGTEEEDETYGEYFGKAILAVADLAVTIATGGAGSSAFAAKIIAKAPKLAKVLKIEEAINLCNCFTAGTKVQTDEGEKNIEDIEVGDKVLSKNEETGEVAYKEVTATFNHETDEIYKIHVGDQTIEATFNHPFWVDDIGWTFVKDLKVGDLLVQSDGNKLKIDSIELEHKHVTVYNMTVDEFHTYFVSDLGIWVHNTGACSVIKAGKNFKSHFLKHKTLLENTLGTKYSTLAEGGPRFLEDIGKMIDDGTVEFVGQGTINRDSGILNIYRGNGLTVVTKSNGEWVTLLETGKAMDLNIVFQ